MNNYKNLKVWKEAMDLCVEVYQSTKMFPKEEIYALTSQVRRSGISIPSNIAEGAGRNSEKDFNNFLGIANGSCNELETQMILAYRLALIDEKTMDQISDKTNYIQKMIFNLQKTLKK